MKLGLQVPSFTFAGGPPALASDLTRIARAAEDGGFDSLWVMDHFYQIPGVGQVEEDMLEAYTTLGFLAGQTSRVGLGALVTGVTYRHPGVLIKAVTTLDVLSGGRAWLGIGAAWFEREHVGLGVPFPPLKERFKRLEEALQIAHQMWSDGNGPYEGKHYQLAETINYPQTLQTPHPRIMIGGTGEKKTLRFVAKYADACNIFSMGGPEFVRQRLGVLREHCEREGRDWDAIDKTIYARFDAGPDGERADALVEQFGTFAEMGVQTVLGQIPDVDKPGRIETIATKVIPQVSKL